MTGPAVPLPPKNVLAVGRPAEGPEALAFLTTMENTRGGTIERDEDKIGVVLVVPTIRNYFAVRRKTWPPGYSLDVPRLADDCKPAILLREEVSEVQGFSLEAHVGEIIA